MNFLKKITLLSFLSMVWISAIGQVSTFNISGTVTDPSGSAVAGATILIWTDTDPVWAFSFETYTDDNGEYQVTYTANAWQGDLNISMVCANSLTTYTHPFYEGVSIVQDFTTCDGPGGGGCSATIAADTSGGAIQYVVYNQSPGPFTYLWSNGATTASIPASFLNEYCVTVTDANGCVATDCYPDNNNSCNVGISENPGGGLNAIVNANAVTFAWSTGETGPEIYPASSGTYCVTATFGDGCTATNCLYFTGGGGTDPCTNVYIFTTPIPGTTGVNACVTPANPAQNYFYQWSTGETTQCIFIYQNGTYCVTLTNSAGESCEYCQTIVINNGGNCGVQIGPGSNLPTTITAYPSGQAPYTYQWNTGENTASIVMTTPGDYCVTVLDATGCEAFACYNYGDTISCVVGIEAIENPLLGTSLYTVTPINLPIISWEWSTGETTEEIIAIQSGLYCVTVTFSNGCQASACYFVSEPGGCEATVSFFNGTPTLIANVTNGTAPYTYLWNNGATTQTVALNSAGVYCCTITDATGCMSSDCFWYNPSGGNDSCGVEISSIPVVWGTFELTANAFGVAPYVYNWSTGQNAETIQYSGDPLLPVCVTVTDANGCESWDCITLSQVVVFNTISGTVSPLDPNVVQTGAVYLIKVEQVQNDVLLTAVDELHFTNQDPAGFHYTFTVQDQECYLIKAALDEGTPGYEGLLPTYYGDVLFWNEASYVCVPSALTVEYDIHLKEGNNPGGPGFIGGLVSEGAGLHDEIDEDRGPGDPIAGATVIVTDMLDNPVLYTYSAADGTYSFSNLAWGTYKVWVEVLGLEPVFAIVTIGPDNPAATNINFEATSAGLTATDMPDNISAISLYPNPVHNGLYLKMNSEKSGDYQINITDLSGKNIYTQSNTTGVGESTLLIPVKDLPSGMYLLNIVSDRQMVTRKFVKQ